MPRGCLVATKTGDIPYIVKDGEPGLLVDLNGHEAMAACALRLLEDEDLVERMRRQGRRNLKSIGAFPPPAMGPAVPRLVGLMVLVPKHRWTLHLAGYNCPVTRNFMETTSAAPHAPSAHFSDLTEKIKTKTARVGVVGLGYVGLPLAVEYAKAGFHRHRHRRSAIEG